MNDSYVLIEDIKKELRPIKSFLLIFKDFEGNIKPQGIGLKLGVSFAYLKRFGYVPENTTRKKFVSLLDWFNDNLNAFSVAWEELEEEVQE